MKERAALADVQLGRATNRSVIGSINEFTYAIDAWFAHRSGDDLEALGLWLCDTPCFPLRTTWPWREAELLLTGRGWDSPSATTRVLPHPPDPIPRDDYGR